MAQAMCSYKNRQRSAVTTTGWTFRLDDEDVVAKDAKNNVVKVEVKTAEIDK